MDETRPAQKAAPLAGDGIYREGLAPASDASEVGEGSRDVARTLRARFGEGVKLYPDNLDKVKRG